MSFAGDRIFQSNPQLIDAGIVATKRIIRVWDENRQHREKMSQWSDFECHNIGARGERALSDWSEFPWTGRETGGKDVGPLEARSSYVDCDYWFVMMDQLVKAPDQDYVFCHVQQNSRMVRFVGWMPGPTVFEHPEWVNGARKGTRAARYDVPRGELFNLDSLRRKHGGTVQEDMFDGKDNPLAW